MTCIVWLPLRLHFISKSEVYSPCDCTGTDSWEGPEGRRALQRHVQHVVDSYRSMDLSAAKLRRKARAAEMTSSMGALGGASGGGGLIDLPSDNQVSSVTLT